MPGADGIGGVGGPPVLIFDAPPTGEVQVYDARIATASLDNPSLFATKRENADHNPKWIKASVNGHTDEATGKVNWTAVVDDVFSQNENGDCLPPDIQAKRQELKNTISYGGPDAEQAASELSVMDHTIVHYAQMQEKNGVHTQTFGQRQAIRDASAKLDDLVSKFGAMAAENPQMGMDMGAIGAEVEEMKKTLSASDPTTAEFIDVQKSLEELDSALQKTEADPSAENVDAMKKALEETVEQTKKCH